MGGAAAGGRGRDRPGLSEQLRPLRLPCYTHVRSALADPSDFAPTPELRVKEEEGRYVVQVKNAASIAHTLAAVALDMSKAGKPPTIHFGWTQESPVSGTLGFLLFGEGNVPWMVRELIMKAEPDPVKRPKVMIADA